MEAAVVRLQDGLARFHTTFSRGGSQGELFSQHFPGCSAESPCERERQQVEVFP